MSDLHQQLIADRLPRALVVRLQVERSGPLWHIATRNGQQLRHNSTFSACCCVGNATAVPLQRSVAVAQVHPDDPLVGVGAAGVTFSESVKRLDYLELYIVVSCTAYRYPVSRNLWKHSIDGSTIWGLHPSIAPPIPIALLSTWGHRIARLYVPRTVCPSRAGIRFNTGGCGLRRSRSAQPYTKAVRFSKLAAGPSWPAPRRPHKPSFWSRSRQNQAHARSATPVGLCRTCDERV